MKLIARLITFVKKDEAQDLIEYTLLVASSRWSPSSRSARRARR